MAFPKCSYIAKLTIIVVLDFLDLDFSSPLKLQYGKKIFKIAEKVSPIFVLTQ